ncbi:MAG: hypothetical protein RLZZ234_16, partial [Candidatus Parcubacteria bacterium]
YGAKDGGLNTHYALLRDPIDQYRSSLCKHTLMNSFKQYEVSGGSIGIWASRLWTQEVSALFLPSDGHETPWDSTPVVGISLKLGYVFLKPNENQTKWVPYVPPLVTKPVRREHATLIVHRDSISELKY